MRLTAWSFRNRAGFCAEGDRRSGLSELFFVEHAYGYGLGPQRSLRDLLPLGKTGILPADYTKSEGKAGSRAGRPKKRAYASSIGRRPANRASATLTLECCVTT